MKRLTILSLILLIYLPFLAVNPTYSFAETEKSSSTEQEVLLVSEDETISVYEDVTADALLTTIPTDTVVTLLNEENEKYSLIRFEQSETETVQGYVENIYVTETVVEEDEDTPVDEELEADTDLQELAENDEVTDSKNEEVKRNDDPVEGEVTAEEATNEEATEEEKAEEETEEVTKKRVTFQAASLQDQAVHSGYALKNKTHVYSATSRNSDTLKSYSVGRVLKYQPYNDSWYKATVYLNHQPHTGYIHKNDVGDTLQGYAQHAVTGVYKDTTKSSPILKSYKAGHLLKYIPYNANWYKATVYVNGQALTGYISKEDVGPEAPSKQAQQELQGYAQLEPTGVYASTSKSSNVLKSYRAGTLLKYRSHNDSWYEATVYVNHKAYIGYIHKDDVGSQIPTLEGLAMASPTKVYSSTSRNAAVLKSYKNGRLLKFQPYNSTWYKARVVVNHKAYTGFIHKNDLIDSSNGKTVVIDAGHGGRDGGTSANGLVEKDLTLELAKKTQRQLENAGFKVIMTRTTDEYISLSERSSFANAKKPDIFVSIHINAGGGTGAETWYQSNAPQGQKSKDLANSIQSELVKETKSRDRGIKDGNLHVNRETNMPSALVEVGFVDHPTDAKNLKSTSFKDKAVKGIVNGIKKFFKLF